MFRILSLDGGGPWALIEVKALIDLYDESTSGSTVLEDFDLVAANSGGSLVLGALLEDMTLGQILKYFTDGTTLPMIFQPTTGFTDRLLDLADLGPKYSTVAKLASLPPLLPKRGWMTLPNAASGIKGHNGKDIHLLITAFDYDLQCAVFFRSADTGGPKTAWGSGAASDDVTVWQAIDASANPPVRYFDAPAQYPGKQSRYWDGGVAGCNNPVLAAVTEAMVLGIQPSNIVALSLGTASTCLPLVPPGANASIYETAQDDDGTGFKENLLKLASSILDDPPDAATFISHVITGANTGLKIPVVSRIVRMNPLISPVKSGGTWGPPPGLTAPEFPGLLQIPMDAKGSQVTIIAQFADSWVANKIPNQPIRMNRATLDTEIGYASYYDAKNAWQKLKALG